MGTTVAVWSYIPGGSSSRDMTDNGPIFETPPPRTGYPPDPMNQVDQWQPHLTKDAQDWLHLTWVDVSDDPGPIQNVPFSFWSVTFKPTVFGGASSTLYMGTPQRYQLSDLNTAGDMGKWNSSAVVDSTTHMFVDVISDGRTNPSFSPPAGVGGIYSVMSTP